MNSTVLFLTALAFGSLPLQGVELRETQFPAKLPKTIVVAGADYHSDKCVKPWNASDAAHYAGRYVSRSITDGSATLDLRPHKAKSSEGEVRWHVDGTLKTQVGLGATHVATVRNAEIQEPKQPCFDVLDRLTPALFVIFTDPELTDKKPRHAVVIGHNVFVFESELKPGS